MAVVTADRELALTLSAAHLEVAAQIMRAGAQEPVPDQVCPLADAEQLICEALRTVQRVRAHDLGHQVLG